MNPKKELPWSLWVIVTYTILGVPYFFIVGPYTKSLNPYSKVLES